MSTGISEKSNARKSGNGSKSNEGLISRYMRIAARADRALWDEFEESKTPEAKFAHVMDNIQPMMLNAANDGKDWKSHGVRLEQILKRNETTPEGSNELWTYAKENFIAPHMAKGSILE